MTRRKMPASIAWAVEEDENGCIVWTKGLLPTGYARTHAKGRSEYVHRIAWEHFHGPIPDGLVLDHLCRNRACCNPDHLEPVTHMENMLRGNTWAAAVRVDHGEYLTTTQAAERLGVTRTTIHGWKTDGRLPVAKVAQGPRPFHLFRRSDVEALAATRTEAAS